MRRCIIPSSCTEYCVEYTHIIHLYVHIMPTLGLRARVIQYILFIYIIGMNIIIAQNVKIAFAPTWFPRESARNPFESRK